MYTYHMAKAYQRELLHEAEHEHTAIGSEPLQKRLLSTLTKTFRNFRARSGLLRRAVGDARTTV